ncbi:MAG: hypothetical protein M5T61_05600 [Acidimicrobiia bacterium]|nr:hypothetical protein [Acidimicrobiia bacterium]
MVFHVVTVHWQSDAWIDPQRRFLDRNLPGGTRYYAALHGVPQERFGDFDYAEDLPGTHPEKLNALAGAVSESAGPDDVLLFVDGDAFPIVPIDESILDEAPLVAVRRDENLGDPQPHPCFCVTTVGLWSEIEGDWTRGHEWVNAAGDSVTDVGGNLLARLESRGVAWRPLLRSNTQNPHPLWFAVYGGIAYHHGAGFRERIGRVDGLAHDLNPRVAASRSHPGGGPDRGSRRAGAAIPARPRQAREAPRARRSAARGARRRDLRRALRRRRLLAEVRGVSRGSR